MFTTNATGNQSLPLFGQRNANARSGKQSDDFAALMGQQGHNKTRKFDEPKSAPKTEKPKNNKEDIADVGSNKPLAVPPGMRQRIENRSDSPKIEEASSRNLETKQTPVGDYTINQTTDAQQNVKAENGLDSKLLELRSSLNQLKDVIDNQNQTVAELSRNQEASFLEEVKNLEADQGFSIKQSAEEKNSEVLFWPSADIDGLELKALPVKEEMWQPIQQQDELAKKVVEQAQNTMNKSDLKIGTKSQNVMSKDLQKTLNESIEQAVNLTENTAKKGIETAGEFDRSQDDALGFENFFVANDQVDNRVDSGDNQTFASAMDQADGESKMNEKIDNMNSIVKQVRTFIRDGGGEMNVELMPEGLGKVQLKVAVDSGKVNVEMLTDNDVARRALEDSLSEMKSSLESQKLIVDNLKVDMSKDYQKDFTQNENFLQEQANRDFAQQFMDNFHNERDERLGTMFEGFRGYIKEPAGPDLALNAQRAYFGEGKGQSLNLKV